MGPPGPSLSNLDLSRSVGTGWTSKEDTMTSFDYTSKIRALFDRAEGEGVTEAERLNCLEKAAALMEKHAIEEHMLRDTDTKANAKVGRRTYFRNEKRAAYVKARRELLFGLAAIHKLKVVSFGANGRDGSEVFGFETDLELIDMLYTSVLVQMGTAMAQSEREAKETGWGIDNTRTWRTSYAHGFIRTVTNRLWQAAQARETANRSAGTDLVLVNRAEIVTKAMNEAYPNTRKGAAATASTRDLSAYGTGARDGRNADLGQQRVGGAGRAALR